MASTEIKRASQKANASDAPFLLFARLKNRIYLQISKEKAKTHHALAHECLIPSRLTPLRGIVTVIVVPC